MTTKKRTTNQIMEDRSREILKRNLPPEWVVRDYRPDYGLDIAIETFASRFDRPEDIESDSRFSYEALGEHIFAQLKSSKRCKSATLELYGRKNVAKTFTEVKNSGNPERKLEVIKQVVDVPELLTVRRMGGVAVVLLVVVDLHTEEAYFVCLNDYIDKVLTPQDPNFAKKGHKTIYIPKSNRILRTCDDVLKIRFYAKRAKMYNAFQIFTYQNVEIHRMVEMYGLPGVSDIIRAFLKILDNLDVWDFVGWRIMSEQYRNQLDQIGREIGAKGTISGDLFHRCVITWGGLSVLGRQYEEVNREWWLPTDLGQALTNPDY